MAMTPSSCFGESNFNASNFGHQFDFTDPFSVTMCMQETAFVVSANVHGFKSEDIRVEIKNRTVFLIIRGGPNCGVHCIESCRLPSNVNVKKISTNINHGVLSVTVPKKKNPPVLTIVTRRGSCFFC